MLVGSTLFSFNIWDWLRVRLDMTLATESNSTFILDILLTINCMKIQYSFTIYIFTVFFYEVHAPAARRLNMFILLKAIEGLWQTYSLGPYSQKVLAKPYAELFTKNIAN